MAVVPMLVDRTIGRAGTSRGEAARLALAVAVVAVTLAAWAWLAVTAVRESLLFDETRFSIARWELTTFANRWLYLAGDLFRDDPSDEQALDRYFAATARLSEMERAAGPAPTAEQARALRELRAERARMENHVEAAVERRISEVLRSEGLTFDLPGPLPAVLWPPVDFELTASPRVLAESPRSEIRLIGDDLLSNDLSPEEAYAVEARTTNESQVAVALTTGGVAAYPSIVDETSSYERIVEIAAHEWLHQYLFFYPLGRRYFTELRDVNETIATIGGRDIAALVLERYPHPGDPPPPSGPASQRVDLPAVLNALRLEVDALLAQGRVVEAEALMERRRRDLEDQGVFIRRLNQAYLAYRGLYATTGASGTDLGARLQALRERERSVGGFIRAVRGISSEAELEAVLSGS